MKNKIIHILILSILCITCFPQISYSQKVKGNYQKYYKHNSTILSSEKQNAMKRFRRYYAEKGYRTLKGNYQDYTFYLSLLKEDGQFSDLSDSETEKFKADNERIITEALNRLWIISNAFKEHKLNYSRNVEIWTQCKKSIIYYGTMEINRPNNNGRFHSSCFAIPTAAVNIYFCHLKEMENAENNINSDTLLTDACEMLKTLGFQAWTQPYRHDETDQNVVSINRFRKHVWWVGGNAIGYRPLLPVAFMLRSSHMVDILSEICQKSLDWTSQTTYETAFWTEGFTADGAGWGHGMQCLVWGYPIDGAINALNILSLLKDSPWEKKLSKQNIKSLMNYFRGSNYYYYKGYILPCLDRYSMEYKPNPEAIRYQKMLKILLNNWTSAFSKEEIAEIKQLYTESLSNNFLMKEYPIYNGTRYFFNNDDLIKKNSKYHVIVNMASIRCDGLESAYEFADGYNLYTTDGSTLFQKTGNEYRKAFGAYDVTAFPGVTAREGKEKLKSVINWRGYCSLYNFAGAATSGGENAAAGYIFEKMNASNKENVNDKGSNSHINEIMYGVKAYKSYFIINDYIIALGAGITNLRPEMNGHIRTCIDQTEHSGTVSIYKGNGIEWIIQSGKFAYSVFPEYQKNFHFTTETRKTDWIKMNPSNKKHTNLPDKVSILQLWIDHGQKPINDTYGYVVYCGNNKPTTTYPFNILRNDTLVQAVCSKDRKVIGAVFYNPMSKLIMNDSTISVSAPCVILFEQQEDRTLLSVTDTKMNKNCHQIIVTLNKKNYKFKMPQGEFCGQPITKKIK